MIEQEALDRIAHALAADARVTVLTGAGVSAASGVPTFRGADGLWRSFRVEELATPEAFSRDPALVWEWYQWRRQTIAACEPNDAHHALASWRLRFPRFTLVTQNVDGLHERAGSDNALRLHGSIWDVGCWRACAPAPYRWRDETVTFPSLPPSCPHCGGPLRPGVVWFGEALDADVMRASIDATACDVFFTVGTSALVHPAAGLIAQARRRGALTVEVNPDTTAASAEVDVVLAAPAELALAELDAALPPHPLQLRSQRLVLTPAMPRDTAALHALWTEPDVRRYLWDDETISLETARAVTSASAADFAAARFGLWTVEPVDGGGLAGFCGLRWNDVDAAPELLFGFSRAWWGRGFAQEASRTVLRHAFDVLHLPRVAGATDVPNERSARTLAALGMRLDRRAEHHGLDTLFYSLDRRDWR